jgi:toluene monooxygenase system protein E
MKGQKTYWHLRDARRKPSEYEITSSRLLTYTAHGFEVNVPLKTWYATYQQGSPLHCSEWEEFRDPRETTYARYAEIQARKETYVSGLLDALDATGYDRNLSPGWLAILERVLAPLRYPAHGLQMLAAYVGHMAPAGRIVIAAGLQAADEMRRVHLLAYRMRQIQKTHPGFGSHAKSVWQSDPLWQPLRQLVERLLVTYDWGEAFTALNLVVKPAVDELFMTHFAQLAGTQGDEILSKIFMSLNEDCAWHRAWSRALVDDVLADDASNRTWLDTWIERWRPEVGRALAAFAPVFDELPERAPRPSFAEVRAAIEAHCRRQWEEIEAGAGNGVGSGGGNGVGGGGGNR